jgi:glutamine synthetase
MDTFAEIPWQPGHGTLGSGPMGSRGTARVICDVMTPGGQPFSGDPRGVLKRQLARANALGYVWNTGPELEFFLFRRDENGKIAPLPHDQAGYFDFSTDLAQEVRQDMVNALEAFGIRVEAAHHEVAPGQHEIDFEYADGLKTADHALTFKFTLKAIAQLHGLYATFMPKPIFGINGSGMHTHQSFYSMEERRNAFADPENQYGLSELARSYMAGILAHARGMIAVLAPGPHEPVRAHPRAEGLAGSVHRGHPRRGPLPRSVIEHVPRVRGDARRRPRRRREGHDARRPRGGEPLRDGRDAHRGEGHQGAAGHARRGPRRARA